MTTPPEAGYSPANATHCFSTARALSNRPSPASRPTRRSPSEQPQRNKSLMRRVEVTALLPDGALRHSQHIAPATAAFEGAFSAFARGTMIQTTKGPCAIEDLSPGDMLEVVNEKPQPVVWIGSMSLVPTAPVEQPELTRLTRIMADTLGLSRPMHDLVLGPGARLLRKPSASHDLATQPQLLTPARAIADGLSIFEITPPTPVKVYHLCLPHHAIISAGGIEVESYHPGRSLLRDMGSNMRALFLSLFPHVSQPDDFGPLACPRADQVSLEHLM